MQVNRNALAAFAFAASAAAQAHQIWIEQPAGGNAVIRFGEYSENLREASPGLLDKFGKLRATLVSSRGERQADAAKTATGFNLPFQAVSGETIVAEDASYPLYTWKQGERQITNWYRPAARYITDFKAQQARLTLDLVPTGNPGEFKVLFKGQPLPKAKISLVVQSGWAKEGHADAQGLVQFDMPWQGTYVAEVSHDDRVAGERVGAHEAEKFDGISYVTSLTFVKADGLPAVPAGPAAAPSK
ncbi:DUF4198 domain-containing protein [Hylemonella sp. W303a]|uniref:DUF4198 domain-containing protein n=1 Tax=Hylemonella sp. W303a TaxID=3389873 RepID=UPI00396B2403